MSIVNALVDGDLTADALAHYMDAREPWRAATTPVEVDMLVDRIEAHDDVILARIEQDPLLGGRLFALAPMLPVLRIFHVLEQRDDTYLQRAVEAIAGDRSAQSLDGALGAVARSRYQFLRQINTLARVLARRREPLGVMVPLGG